MRDLSKRHSDYATFLPAISGFFTELLGRCNSVEGYIPNVDGRDRVPQGFEHGFAGMNFLDREKGYYYYDKALYSAGHAYLDLDKSEVMEYIIHTRDKNATTIVGDGSALTGLPAGYSNTDVDTHLNQNNPTQDYVLSWNGSDYAWVVNNGTVFDLVQDLTPQLGGDLDVQTHEIKTTSSNRDIVLRPHGTGGVIVSDEGESFPSTPTPNKGKLTVVHDGGTGPTLLLTDSDGDSFSGPNLNLYRDSSSVNANDILGKISWHGNNNNAEIVGYGSLTSDIVSATDGSENGRMNFGVLASGTHTTMASITGTGLGIGVTSPEAMLHLRSDTADVTLKIEADESNDDEDDNPMIWMCQDGELVSFKLGLLNSGNHAYMDWGNDTDKV